MIKKKTTTKKVTTIKKAIKKKTRASVPYDDWLLEKLKDHDLAVAYLNAALEESTKDAEGQKIFLTALHNVAQAQGRMAKLAKRAHVGRESLYKTLSATGNPEFSTVNTLIGAMGFGLRFV